MTRTEPNSLIFYFLFKCKPQTVVGSGPLLCLTEDFPRAFHYTTLKKINPMSGL